MSQSDLYDSYYYRHCCGSPMARDDVWLRFFGGVADRIIQDIRPRSVLDAGCAMGFLVECLRDRGVEAYGIDVSEFAIGQVREDMKPHCRVGSVLDPLPRQYDLIVCIEVLEHLSLIECHQAVGWFCDAAGDILFSSTPDDFMEATHINVQPPAYWVGLFARRNFWRDVLFDATFITPWAMRFRKSDEPAYRQVEAYEQRLWALSKELIAQRRLALESRQKLAEQQRLLDYQAAPGPATQSEGRGEPPAVISLPANNTPVPRRRPAERTRALIISHDVVGARMAGPGIRYWELARILSRYCDVTLAVPSNDASPGDPSPGDGFAVRAYEPGDWNTFKPLVDHCDVVMPCGHTIVMFPALAEGNAPIVIDGYDPYLLETLARQAEAPDHSPDSLPDILQQMRVECLSGDFFLCASERQRDWWLGMLAVHGRLNIHTYRDDPSLRNLVAVVPYGCGAPPAHTRQVLKGIVPGIELQDKVVLWGGGLWQWLDPLTLLRAFRQVVDRRRNVKLVFPGTRHPNATVPVMSRQQEAVELAGELGLLDRHVFFGDWVLYADWPNYLLEADVAVSLHFDNVETRLAFRSRVLDYIRADLPMVLSRGDATSEMVADYDLGILVDCGDDGAVANALAELLDEPRGARREQFARAQADLAWARVAQPLVDFCLNPRRSADHRPGATPAQSRDELAHEQTVQQLQVQLRDTQTHIGKLKDVVDGYERGRFIRFARKLHEWRGKAGL